MRELEPPSEFLDRAAAMGIEFESGDVQRLGRYLGMLLEANQRFNLTAITDPTEAWLRHVLDSLSLVPHISSAEASTVIDVGSGGGLPGIPLAIVLPDVRFALLEATGKKALFLQTVALELALSNIAVINDRAENIGQDHHHHREHYDVALARAVGRLPVLLELTVPLVKIGGVVLAMKGEQAEAEIAESKAALHLLHVAIADVHPSTAPGGGKIIVIEKLRKTPRLYPRPPGTPKRSPLGVGKRVS